jgi:hypothetical protein
VALIALAHRARIRKATRNVRFLSGHSRKLKKARSRQFSAGVKSHTAAKATVTAIRQEFPVLTSVDATPVKMTNRILMRILIIRTLLSKINIIVML